MTQFTKLEENNAELIIFATILGQEPIVLANAKEFLATPDLLASVQVQNGPSLKEMAEIWRQTASTKEGRNKLAHLIIQIENILDMEDAGHLVIGPNGFATLDADLNEEERDNLVEQIDRDLHTSLSTNKENENLHDIEFNREISDEDIRRQFTEDLQEFAKEKQHTKQKRRMFYGILAGTAVIGGTIAATLLKNKKN